MTGSGSPCGACKFLRRKCIRGCIFAPYFCHEQGASHFAAIHKVFGASNVSKLLTHLPVSDRPGAAVTISYEAQARLKDPIYGCVSHIFALQQQVINLQAQLASIKEQAAQNFGNSSGIGSNENPNEKYIKDVQNWFQSETNMMMMMTTPQFNPNMVTSETYNASHAMPYTENKPAPLNSNSGGSSSCENSMFDEAYHYMSSLDSLQQAVNRQMDFQDYSDDHHHHHHHHESVPFSYTRHS
ncbi:LOB domain-containing protein 29-like [Humulus lupulus]|uniref:LOB domain-containing protein 29-like n=1 Tax=Humulus lupulus TaxID=3486 RepID=UPI002B411CE3|nr:LOB domain-containing protein 29-like [Humulus lupulus]